MNLLKTLKSIFWIFIVLFILSLGLNIWKISLIETNHWSMGFILTDIANGVLDAILAIVLGIFGIRLLNGFKVNNVDFHKISNNLKYIGFTFIIGVIAKTFVQISIQSSHIAGIYLKAINDFILIGLLGFFLLAISMVIKKADYYKTQNDLTI